MDSPSSPDEFPPGFYIGQHESNRQLPITAQVLRQAQDCNYDMLTTPITTPRFHKQVLALLPNYLSDAETGPNGEENVPVIPALSAADTPLAPGDTIGQSIGIVSPWIDLSSPDPVIYNVSRQVLELEMKYAAFCGMNNVIVPGPHLHYGDARGEGVAQYAYALQEALGFSIYTQVMIKLPMMDHPDYEDDDMMGSLAPFARPKYERDGAKRKVDLLGTWDAWHIIRSVCKYNARLSVALSIPRHLPPLAVQSRWHSEPLRILMLTSKTFLPNPQGYPVLTKDHQSLVFKYMRIRNPPWILLGDVGPIPGLDDPDAKILRADGFLDESASNDATVMPTPAEASQQSQVSKSNKGPKDSTPHLSYIRNLQRRQPSRSIVERYGAGYQDYLQGPLQPLADNLESITYEVFEKDPVKYDLYETSIRKALIDWVEQGRSSSGPDGRIVIAVVGAGRGPLVTRALRASEDAVVHTEIWALEKNPNAFILLQRHNASDWDNQVHLVHSDMRAWKGPSRPLNSQTASATPTGYKVDILISELLGSFADNELSPECLDGVVPLLNPKDGISIPSSYSSYLTPISAPKLHADIAARTSDPSAANTPYVVWLHSIDYLSTSPASPGQAILPNVLKAWDFHHRRPLPPPSSSSSSAALQIPYPGNTTYNNHNARHARLHFPIPDRGVCHGLAGYFEAVLYGDVQLSTHPTHMTHKSPDMMSWFPIFFPLKTPFYLPPSSALTASIWRATDGRKVWYEWMVEGFLELPPSSSSSSLSPPSNSNSNSNNRSSAGGAGGEEMGMDTGGNKGGGGKGQRIRLGVSEMGSSREGGCVI